MIYAAEARKQISALRDHYERLQRTAAIKRLQAALRAAERQIETGEKPGLPAPRPYPALARPDRAWINAGRYWIAYSLTVPPVILGVFYDQADIPGRL